jgi:hypothetical protein
VARIGRVVMSGIPRSRDSGQTSRRVLTSQLDVKPVLHGVALLALVAAVSACGGHTTATSLRITVWNGPHVREFTLRCEPSGGSAPQPASICAELRRSPKMLARGRALGNSCPGVEVRRAVRVKGRYRGKRVDAGFSIGGCEIVVGQDAAPATWWILMRGASV